MNVPLHDLEISQSDYDKMLDEKDFKGKDWNYLPIGTFFKTKDGHICRIVKSDDLFLDQVGGAVLSLPEVGLQHWKPVFVNIKTETIQAILSAHQFPFNGMTMRVKLDDAEYIIVGERTNIINISTPSVELLAPESTPSRPIVSKLLAGQLEDPLRKLIKEGVEFITVLRYGWALPAVTWRISK